MFPSCHLSFYLLQLSLDRRLLVFSILGPVPMRNDVEWAELSGKYIVVFSYIDAERTEGHPNTSFFWRHLHTP